MNSIFGGHTCEKVALQLEKHIHGFLVFSICSDERLPDGLEKHLRNNKGPDYLLIVGDFMLLPPSKEESPASYEAIKLILTQSNLKKVNVAWVSGADIAPDLHQTIKWHAFYLPNNVTDDKKDTSLINNINLVSSKEKKIYQHICKLLSFPVYVGVKNNQIVTIDLTDNHSYPRGLTNNLPTTQMLELWRNVSQLRYLKKINARFNGLSFLPDFSSLTHLEKLDLRGNPYLDFNELSTAKALLSLNISACSLTELPNSINSLHNLKSLLAYKNHITDLSNIKFPKSIERISFYRNQISSKTLELSHCGKLQEINLGANPIATMTLKISPALPTLQLRARYIKSAITISGSENTAFCICEY